MKTVRTLLALVLRDAHARYRAAWPSRPLKLICPFPAGGGTDVIARIIGQHLSARLGQQVVVENRGGANGGIGAMGATTHSDSQRLGLAQRFFDLGNDFG